MNNWFVIGWLVTVVWGNGAIEEGRMDSGEVFYGTAEQCEEVAESVRARFAEDSGNHSGMNRNPADKHAYRPGEYNNGIVSMNYAATFCIPFRSHEHIKATFPDGHGWKGGARIADDGSVESFRWWDGAEGEAFD